MVGICCIYLALSYRNGCKIKNYFFQKLVVVVTVIAGCLCGVCVYLCVYNMCVCMCVCLLIYVCLYVCLCVSVSVCVSICVCPCASVCVCVSRCVYLCVYKRGPKVLCLYKKYFTFAHWPSHQPHKTIHVRSAQALHRYDILVRCNFCCETV